MTRADRPHPRWIAHRGWSTRFPENSLAALAAAVAAGADELEFDLRSSADGVSVILHDATLDRTHALTGPVEAYPYAELVYVDAKQSDGGWLPGMGLPTLADVLSLFAGRVELNVHVKAFTPSLDELDLLAGAAASGARLYVAGSVSVMRSVIERRPELRRCLIQLPGDLPADSVKAAGELGCERIQFFTGHFAAGDVTLARDAGLTTNLFFADDVDAVAAALDWGIDAILTNDVGAIKQAHVATPVGG